MQAVKTNFSAAPKSRAQEPVEQVNMPKLIAENIFKDLRSYGLKDKDIVAVSSELLGKLTSDIQTRKV